MGILRFVVAFAIIIAALFVIKFVVERINRKMIDDYGSMLENSEKSDSEERKKSSYIFFKKKI